MNSFKQIKPIFSENSLTLPADALKARWIVGLDYSPPIPASVLPIDALKTAPEVFQYRMRDYSGKESEEHIRSLVRSIKTYETPLPPMTVFYVCGEYYIIDGHHRYEAYVRARYDVPEIANKIPVVEFMGGFQEALLEACQANTRDKLNMCVSEKRNAAWRLLLECERRYGDYKAISRATGISKNTVTKYAKLQDDIRASGEDPATLTVNMALYEQRETPEYNDDWQDAQASHMASKLRKAGGPMLRSHPEVTSKALLELLGEENAKAVVYSIASTLSLQITDPECNDLDF